LTCVHEAGHAVIALEEQFDVTAVTIHRPGHGVTSGIDRKDVRVAVAGYGAVEAVLGGEARASNVAADKHTEPYSDVIIALGAADEAGYKTEHEVWTHIEAVNAEILERLTGHTLEAIARVALYLAEMSGGKTLLGDGLRREIELAREAESGALESLRAWWEEVN
jgi:hypothetical protein